MYLAVFERFAVTEDCTTVAQPSEPFRSLLSPDILVRTDQNTMSRTSADNRPPRAATATRAGRTRLCLSGCRSTKASPGVVHAKGFASCRPRSPNTCSLGLNKVYLAEGVGFEPTGLLAQSFSRASHSSTLPSLRELVEQTRRSETPSVLSRTTPAVSSSAKLAAHHSVIRRLRSSIQARERA